MLQANIHVQNLPNYSNSKVKQSLAVHKSVHRDTTMKITNKMHYID